jgi:16S rRNA (guanine527-N7)-methyltransferase
LTPADREQLVEALTAARSLGFLGPGPIESHIEHSLEIPAALPSSPGRAVDLGSGGGVPGLVLACAWPESQWTLLDANQRRTRFLVDAVSRLGIEDRVTVVTERAEIAGRSHLRSDQDLVVARGFGPPAVTAECAAPFLRVGGYLVVTEPPGGDIDRWPVEQLRELGLVHFCRVLTPVALQVLVQERPSPSRYPRRVGVPTKRSLW